MTLADSTAEYMARVDIVTGTRHLFEPKPVTDDPYCDLVSATPRPRNEPLLGLQTAAIADEAHHYE